MIFNHFTLSWHHWASYWPHLTAFVFNCVISSALLSQKFRSWKLYFFQILWIGPKLSWNLDFAGAARQFCFLYFANRFAHLSLQFYMGHFNYVLFIKKNIGLGISEKKSNNQWCSSQMATFAFSDVSWDLIKSPFLPFLALSEALTMKSCQDT